MTGGEGAQTGGTVEYMRQLEDACLILWAELPTEQTLLLRAEMPRLMDFMAHLHHSIEHVEAAVRRNVWADSVTP